MTEPGVASEAPAAPIPAAPISAAPSSAASSSAAPSSAEPSILVEQRGAVLHIGLNRPAKRNAADRAMLRGLSDALTRMERDDTVRVGLVWAVGEHFTAGLDLRDVGGSFAGGGIPARADDGIDPFQLDGPERTKPLIIAVQGTCYTLGVELMLASDITVAAESASFGQIEVTRGLLPFGGATLRFPQIAGWGNAMRWMLTGDRFDAAEAYRMGLVQQVVPEGTARDAAAQIAERIALQAPLAVRATLANARLARQAGPEAAAAALPAALAALAATDDVREGIASLIERRDARFSGS